MKTEKQGSQNNSLQALPLRAFMIQFVQFSSNASPIRLFPIQTMIYSCCYLSRIIEQGPCHMFNIAKHDIPHPLEFTAGNRPLQQGKTMTVKTPHKQPLR